jgi:hypothetical protein
VQYSINELRTNKTQDYPDILEILEKYMVYLIKVSGVLDESWSSWLDNTLICIEEENGVPVTIIRGDVPDQPALFGILDRIRDLNLTLISVEQFNRIP